MCPPLMPDAAHWPGAAFDAQATARHQAAGLITDVAFDHDLAPRHLLPDLVEPIARRPRCGYVAGHRRSGGKSRRR